MKLNHFFGISLLFYRATHLAFANEHHGHEHRGGHEHHDGHEHNGRHLEGGRSCGTIDQTEKEQASVKAEIDKWLATNKDKSLAPVEIETIIHVVYPNNNPSANEVYENEQAQVDVLNYAFNTTTRFSFKLVEVQEHNNNNWWNDGSSMKPSTRSGTYATLNVWFNTAGGYLGYASFPSFNSGSTDDGVVCVHSSGPGGSYYPYNEGDTLVHEVGHWMHLYHTFQGGCSDGDQVEDTPAEADPTGGCPPPNTVDTCPNSPGFDSTSNYMNYVDDLCMLEFTEGQIERMDAAWELYRAPYAVTNPTASPNTGPSVSPSTSSGSCEDAATGTFDVVKPDGTIISGRTCQWVGLHADFRCGFDGAPDNCPVTCEACPGDCTDTTGTFDVVKPDGTIISGRTCQWVGLHADFRCDFDGAPDNCPSTCGLC